MNGDDQGRQGGYRPRCILKRILGRASSGDMRVPMGVESSFSHSTTALKTALAIVTLSALVSACAVAPQAPEAAAPKQAAPAEPAANSDLMYRVTKAEMEFREGR